jgi:hypothetical protein
MSNNRLHKYSLHFGETKTCIHEFCSIGREKFTLVHNIIVTKVTFVV